MIIKYNNYKGYLHFQFLEYKKININHTLLLNLFIFIIYIYSTDRNKNNYFKRVNDFNV